MSNTFAFLYGLIQGLTEFLPISSSGHLALIPAFFDIPDPGVAFDLLMHLGTALAVLVYYRIQWWDFAKNLFFPKRWDKKFKIIMVASLITFAVALVFKKAGSTWARDPNIISFNLIIFGFLMWYMDKTRKQKEIEDEKKLAFFLGIAQALAIFPGVSRSGATITMARWLELDKKTAGDLSFMLSLPVILGGILFLSLKGEMSFTQISTVQMFIGVTTAFVSGLLAIKFFLMVLQRFSLLSFFLYRLLLGLGILLFF